MGDAYGDVEGSIIPIWSMFSNSLSTVSCMACGSGYGLLCTGSSVVNVMECYPTVVNARTSVNTSAAATTRAELLAVGLKLGLVVLLLTNVSARYATRSMAVNMAAKTNQTNKGKSIRG